MPLEQCYNWAEQAFALSGRLGLYVDSQCAPALCPDCYYPFRVHKQFHRQKNGDFIGDFAQKNRQTEEE